ncbi:GldM family protein [Crocinitomix catalasitica]|uniref:GldM family protein n=1 Tax=Crocinitomix catalasitica TaxID=184607 RepID=UPI000488A5B2|nr:GldM family protein [Crocinitomix catalasitica]
MKNRKINIDRPHLDSSEIMARRNFSEVLGNHAVLTKPFYKQYWFMGTSGIATVSLIIGGVVSFNASDEQIRLPETAAINIQTDAPPLLAQLVNVEPEETVSYLSIANEEVTEISNETENKSYDKKTTLSKKEVSNAKSKVKKEEVIQETSPKFAVETSLTESYDANEMELAPRIHNKLGGKITRSELLDNKGITTVADISIIHFEMHLIDGLGGEVFEAENNQLNDEMKKAIAKVEEGETIYFQNIKARIKDGLEIRLNPLRYVLAN